MDAGQSNATTVTYFGMVVEDEIMTVEQKELARYIMEAGISTVLILVSIVGNGLATIVFFQMGYKETINISMTFICGMDCVRCLLSLAYNLHFPIRFISPVLSTAWDGIGRVIFGYSSSTGSFVSMVYAAQVSLERCLCVSMPFTVKHLLTPRVVWINNILITFVVTASFFLFYSCYTINWVYNPELNATVPVAGFSPFFFKYPEMSSYISLIIPSWSILSFVIICICTSIISYHLRRSSKFKSRATQQGGKVAGGLSTRDKQVIKMLLVVIAVYVVVIFPRIVCFLARFVFPDFDLMGRESNIFQFFESLVILLDFINPATNFFIFYFMSSQFKTQFLTFIYSK